ncbi:hypothetical protein LX15_005666 [Streptoalloteichus tenebrarius]|uniref:Integral membrane protein n=1 Tax=Streptoalloteichus tenebrarius (strain ATCC 17920 / DSM 40477 / JCM 4838 / CBS 697.72 / NBRC 16177 / NCIMB 11028 / NRRL B-12390 / A12253. 1 / ISP 5477) TaxID=1933 RepID=A0ABT1I2E8_STRSD|nr:hypothetical protein [Streptoalloteichus tenebrarius]MCP2261939.1 hypothetical protein [Streptoalloteichus tenebrarius]BFF02068.1 hypothetical protein GCM10020241_37430 [Streptoalloteichus tenebrarius]
MDDATTGYLFFLLIGALLVLAVGRLLARSGRTVLHEVFPERDAARSVSRLIAVLFHLVTLGLLALIAIWDPSADDPTQALLAKFGVLLLALGLTYGITLVVLSRVQTRRRDQLLAEHLTAQTEAALELEEERAHAEGGARTPDGSVVRPVAEARPVVDPAAPAPRTPRSAPSPGHRTLPPDLAPPT